MSCIFVKQSRFFTIKRFNIALNCFVNIVNSRLIVNYLGQSSQQVRNTRLHESQVCTIYIYCVSPPVCLSVCPSVCPFLHPLSVSINAHNS